jgi:Flp pilus assembly protein TadG
VSARRGRQAQVLVEFALVLPLLMTLVFAIVEMGWLFYQDHTINSACRRASRMAAVGATVAQVRSYVQSACGGLDVPASAITVTEVDVNQTTIATNADAPRRSGNDIRVQVLHNLKFFTPIQGVFRRMNVLQISSSSQYVIE